MPLILELWVLGCPGAQSVMRLSSPQVMMSRFASSSSMSGCPLSACFGSSVPSLSLPLPHALCLYTNNSINIFKKELRVPKSVWVPLPVTQGRVVHARSGAALATVSPAA